MKVITIKQPHASLICEGIKDIENRSWSTKFRGRILIHAAAKQVKGLACEALTPLQYSHVFSADKLNYLTGAKGAIIGAVEIVDCVENHPSIWAIKGQYHWVLQFPQRFDEPIPVKGKLGLWNYPNIIAEPEEPNGELFCHCQLSVKESNQVYSMIDHYRCHYCGGRWYK